MLARLQRGKAAVKTDSTARSKSFFSLMRMMKGRWKLREAPAASLRRWQAELEKVTVKWARAEKRRRDVARCDDAVVFGSDG